MENSLCNKIEARPDNGLLKFVEEITSRLLTEYNVDEQKELLNSVKQNIIHYYQNEKDDAQAKSDEMQKRIEFLEK